MKRVEIVIIANNCAAVTETLADLCSLFQVHEDFEGCDQLKESSFPDGRVGYKVVVRNTCMDINGVPFKDEDLNPSSAPAEPAR